MLSIVGWIGVYFIDLYLELVVVFLAHKQIVVQFMKELQLQMVQV
jgi:hypothetical protein